MSTSYLTTSAGRLAYDVTGPADAPLIVCTAGMGDVRGSYRFLVPPLVAAGYRVATMDIRGLGESDAHWADYSPAAIGEDILALITHLGGPAVLITNSYTGASGVHAAARAPEQVSGLVLISAFLRHPPAGALARLLEKTATPIVNHITGAWVAYYRSLYKGAKPTDLADYTAALKANLREPGRMAAFRATTRNGNADNGREIGAVRCPTLVVMGGADPDFPDPAAEAAWIEARLREGGTEVRTDLVTGCGHYPQAEAPEHTAAAVTAFLSGVRGA